MDVVGNMLVVMYGGEYGSLPPACNYKRVVTIEVYSENTSALPWIRLSVLEQQRHTCIGLSYSAFL